MPVFWQPIVVRLVEGLVCRRVKALREWLDTDWDNQTNNECNAWKWSKRWLTCDVLQCLTLSAIMYSKANKKSLICRTFSALHGIECNVDIDLHEYRNIINSWLNKHKAKRFRDEWLEFGIHCIAMRERQERCRRRTEWTQSMHGVQHHSRLVEVEERDRHPDGAQHEEQEE